MKCAVRNVESSDEKAEIFPEILLTPRTHKVINHLFFSPPRISNVVGLGGSQKRLSSWQQRQEIHEMTPAMRPAVGCISVVELIMEMLLFFS